MKKNTAVFILQALAKLELISTKLTTFTVARIPQPVDLLDVEVCFRVLRDECGGNREDLFIHHSGVGMTAWTSEELFEKLFKVIFVQQLLYPAVRSDNIEGGGPLPNLFVSSEKTQVRQIPLSEGRPWPFKFLLELGGMIVVKTPEKRDFLLELRQFINNHPQYRIKVDAKEWPTGEVAVFTYWFEKLPHMQRRKNLNVPE